MAAVAGAGIGVIAFDQISSDYAVAALVLIGSCIPMLALPRGRLAVGVAALAATWFVVYLTIEMVPRLLEVAPDVSSAIGQAAYLGIAYQDNQIALVVAMAFLVAVGILVSAHHRRHRPENPPASDGPVDESPRRPTSRATSGLAITVLAFAFTLAPDLDSAFAPVGPRTAFPDWDNANLTVWNVLIGKGLIPMRDFFYPYGGQWVFQLVPAGPALKWLAEAAMLALAAWALWRLSEGRALWRVVLCLAVVVVLGAWKEVTVWRYLPGLLVPLSYAALGPVRHRQLTLGHLFFGAACLLAAFVEVDLLLYGAAGVVLVLLGETLSGSLSWRSWGLLQRLAVDLLPALAAVGLVIAFWAATGSLAGNLGFFGGLGSVSVASAIDTAQGALYLYSLKPSLPAVALACPALLLVAGLVSATLSRPPRRDVAMVLLSGAGVSLVFALKDLNRYIASQSMVPALIALAWAAVLLVDRRRVSLVAATAVFGAGALSALPGTDGHLAITSYLRAIVSSPARAFEVAKLPFDSAAVHRRVAERVAYGNYPGSAVVKAAQSYRREVPHPGGKTPRFAVIGDGQLLYALLDQEPPYQTEMYDASPISQQRGVISELTDRRPPFMVWFNDRNYTDDIPYQVRVPLIYRYAVEHYVPYRQHGSTLLLRRRSPGDPLAVDFWRAELGTLDLGFIPSLSDGVDAAQCSGGEGCNPYVVVEGPGADSVETIGVQLDGPHGQYEVRLRSAPGKTRYAIRLDRLWFARLLGPDPSVLLENPGWTARLESLRTGGDLY